MGAEQILGVLSDTETDEVFSRAAAEAFTLRGCTHVLHCGDVRSPVNLEQLAHPARELRWIPGDEDFVGSGIRPDLLATSLRVGAVCAAETLDRENGSGQFNVGDFRVAATHNPYGGNGVGTNRGLVRSWSGDSSIALVVYGHFHYFNVRCPGTAGVPMILCPGGHQRTVPVSTCAVVTFGTASVLVDILWFERAAQVMRHVLSIDGTHRDASQAVGWSPVFVEDVRAAYNYPGRSYWRENWRWSSDSNGWFPVGPAFLDGSLWQASGGTTRTIAGAITEPKQAG